MEVFKELPVKYNYQVGRYQLDFAIPEKKIYVEIDGEQHQTDERQRVNDAIKDGVFSKANVRLIRKSASSVRKNCNEIADEIINIVLEIYKLLSERQSNARSSNENNTPDELDILIDAWVDE